MSMPEVTTPATTDPAPVAPTDPAPVDPSPPPADPTPVPTDLPTTSPLTGQDYDKATTDAIHARLLDVEAALVQVIAHVGINLDYASLPSQVADQDKPV